ncbi:MAG: diguanylate cyclase [Candidatus Aegiribacteria sp.]
MEITPEILERFGISGASSLSYVDHLTGLPNRRFLRSVLDRLIGDGGPFSVLFMDLDNFKQVNDTAGHEEGDRLLRRLGRILPQSLRKRDLVVRYGGDEFVIILSGGEHDEATLVAEKIITSVDRELGSLWGVSASIGIACHPEHASVPSDLLSMSDRAMYAAKASGKACWRLAAPEGSEVFWHEDVFLARNLEMDRAVSLLENSDSNAMVLIEGETGSGKTSFLDAVGRRLSHRRVMRIGARQELAGVPWAALAASVRKYAPDLPDVELPDLWSNLLGRLIPDVFGESSLSDSIMDRFALLDAFSSLFTAWTPLLILVDNAHWLDRETVSLLGYALQTGIDSGLSVCAAFTGNGDAGENDSAGLLRHIGASREIELGRLSLFQTGELIKGRLGVVRGVDEFAEMVYRFSGGNPLFACEYIRTMLNAGLLRVESGKLLPFSLPSTVPNKIRNIVAGKIGSLDRETLRILQQASVFRKEPLELDLLSGMSGRTEGEILSALDEGLRRGILRTGIDDTMSFHFTNEAFREEVYSSAGSASTRRYHALVAQRRKREGDHLNAGYHLEKSGETLEALEIFGLGAESSLRAGLPAAAVACLEEAERLSRQLPEARFSIEKHAELKFELLCAYRLSGNWPMTRKTALQHAELADELNMPENAISSRLLAADCLRMTGDMEKALEELSELEPVISGYNLVDCLIKEADNLSRLGRTDTALEKLNSADGELGKLHGDEQFRYLETELIHHRMLIAMLMEDFSAAGGLSIQLLKVSREIEDGQWWYFYDVAETMLLAGRPVTSASVFKEGVERAELTASLHGSLMLKAEMADALYHAFDLESAELVRREAVDLADKFSEVKVLDDMTLIRVELDMESGQLGPARNRLNDLLCRQPENPAVAVVNSYLLEMEEDMEGSLDEIRRAAGLLNGSSMTSIIFTSVIVTADEIKLQEAWVSSVLQGTDWREAAEGMIPELNDRAAFRASGLLAKWLHDRGRTDEAELVMSQALNDPRWKEMRLFRYRNLIIRSAWDIDAAEEAHDLMQRSRV